MYLKIHNLNFLCYHLLMYLCPQGSGDQLYGWPVVIGAAQLSTDLFGATEE